MRKTYFGPWGDWMGAWTISQIVCIGEPLDIYKSKKIKNFLKKQINKIFKKSNIYNEVILAYEPLWSIGTGLTPKMSEINDILQFLTKILKNYSFKKVLNHCSRQR